MAGPPSLRSLVEQAARAGGRAVRCVCSATPRELVEALGLEAGRLVPPGSVASLSRGEALTSPSACAWCKSALGALEPGTLWVGAATCDQMRRTLEIAGRTSGAASIVVHAPKTRTPEAEAFYASELAWAAAELGRRAGRALDPESLRRAIRVRNVIRRRIRDHRPRLSGSDFARLVLLDALWPAASTIALLDGGSVPASAAAGLPLLLAGSPVAPADLPWLERLESAGFRIVADATCTGDRAVDFEVDEAGDPLEALARAYFRRPPCVYVRPNDGFYEYARGLADRRGAAAAVWRSVRGCDLYALEAGRAEARLGLPMLALDMSGGDADSPRLRTRIEAFAERFR